MGDPAVEACVMAAGTSISDSPPPSDSASVKTCARSTTRTAASPPPRSVNDTIPPPLRICRRASSC
jgi:hypothetical protein